MRILSVVDLKEDVLSLGEVRAQMPDNPRLIEDAGLDSFALIELLVVLEEKYDLELNKSQLVARDWRGVTVNELYEQICREVDGRTSE